MRVSVVAGLIVGVHVAVIGSVVMTQGCVSAQRGESSTTPTLVEAPPPPVLAPSVEVINQPVPVDPILFPSIEAPVKPEPLKTSVSAENVYVIKSGDSLSKIAISHGVNTRELAELNQITDANKIRIGQKLILPDHSKPSSSQPTAKKSSVAKAPSTKKAAVVSGDAYVVKSGDALSKIAALHGVKTKELMAANNIKDANRIRIGQKLVIPGGTAAPAKAEAKPAQEKKEAVKIAPLPAPVAVPAALAPVVAPAAPAPVVQSDQEDMLDYTVQEGDTAEGIARLFVVRKDDILSVNQIPAGSDVKPGQKIKIPPSSL